MKCRLYIYNLISSFNWTIYLIPSLLLSYSKYHYKNVFAIGIKFLFFVCIFEFQWYRSKPVEDLRKDYERLQQIVNSDTGVAL